MARRTLRPPRIAAVFAAALALLAVATGCGSAGGSAAAPSCSDAILDDWADGRIDGTYDAECYLEAIDALPEDVRAYSSAEDDISRALLSLRTSDTGTGIETASRTLSQATASDSSDGAGTRSVPTALAAIASVALVVLAGGLAAALSRRHRRRA
jgi:hypothetical protein